MNLQYNRNTTQRYNIHIQFYLLPLIYQFHHPSWPTDLFTILIYLIITIDIAKFEFLIIYGLKAIEPGLQLKVKHRLAMQDNA